MEVECSICQHPQPALAVMVLPCSHRFHQPCLRSQLKTSPSPSLLCPRCRTRIPESVLYRLRKERRLLQVRYLLSGPWLEQEDGQTTVRAVVRLPSGRVITSDAELLSDLEPSSDSQHPDARLFEAEFILPVRDPKTTLDAWIESVNVQGWTRYSDLFSVGTRALDHESEEEKEKEEEVGIEEPQVATAPKNPTLMEKLKECIRRHALCKVDRLECSIRLEVTRNAIKKFGLNPDYQNELTMGQTRLNMLEIRLKNARRQLNEARDQLKTFFLKL